MSHISSSSSEVPLVLLGSAGSGKSSIMAKIADMTVTKAMQGGIPGSVFHATYLYTSLASLTHFSSDSRKS